MWGRTSLPDGLPSLRSFDQAVRHYESVKPLKSGYDQGLIPLGSNRRYKRSQMIRGETRRGVEYIVCRYWQRDAITFFADNTIKFDIGMWHTPTTLMFLRDVFGTNSFHRHKEKIYYANRRDGKFFYLNPVEGLTLDASGSPIDPMPEIRKTMDRKAWYALKAKFKPFLEYSQDMVRMMEPRPSQTILYEFNKLVDTYGLEYWRPMCTHLHNQPDTLRIPYMPITAREIKYDRSGDKLKKRTEYFRRIAKAVEENDLDQMYPLMFVLQACASSSQWTANGYIDMCSPDGIKKYFHELMKFEFCRSIFFDEVQPIGDLVSDPNIKYFVEPLPRTR